MAPKSHAVEDNLQLSVDSTVSVGQIVAQFPATADVLKSYRIDFCCEGERPLAEVLKEHDLHAEEVINKLIVASQIPKEAEGAQRDWRKADSHELIDHIVETHHDYLYNTLPGLARYVLKIDDVHGGRHPELSRVRECFAAVHKELMIHLPKEEQDLFPAFKKYEKHKDKADLKQCVDILEELESEHDACGDLLKEIRTITNDYALPDDACTTYQLTFQKLQELESDIFQHIHLENNILFPRLQN